MKVNTEFSTKLVNNKSKPDSPYIGNGPVKTIEADEPARHKFVINLVVNGGG